MTTRERAEAFWKAVAELARLRDRIPPERRQQSLVRQFFQSLE